MNEHNLRPFTPGHSGNPGGRPKGLARRVRELVGNDGEPLAHFMLDVLQDEAALTRDRMAAATWLADRGWGKPTQRIAGDDEHDPIQAPMLRRADIDPARLAEALRELGLVRALPCS